MSVVSRRPHVTVVAKRDTSNEHVRVANNLKRKERRHPLRTEGRRQNGLTKIRAMRTLMEYTWWENLRLLNPYV